MSEQAYPTAVESPLGRLRGRARDRPWPPAPAWLVAGIGVLALAATGAAVYTTAVSRHAPNPVGHAALSVLVCLSFVGAGLIALRRPPYVRFGLLLAAVGFSSLLGALHDANNAVLYTIGVFTANLGFALLVYALLAFPLGRLGSRTSRLLVLAAFVAVLGVQALAVLFDPLTRWHSDHPANVALVASNETLSTVLEELEAVVAIVVALAVATVLYRRTRAKSAVARRQLVPVLVGGVIGLVLFAVGLALAPLSSEAAVVGIGLGLLASIALPAAFLGSLLQGRLSRAAVGNLLVELREGAPEPGLEQALQRALGDPSLELAARDEDGTYRDRSGRPFVPPGTGDARVATPISHQGETVGMLVHDRSLRLRPELLDAVSAAAGFALTRERALETVRRVEARDRALLDAIPDAMYRLSRDGICLDARTDDLSTLFHPPEEMIGRHARELLPAELADAILDCAARALETGQMSFVEYEVEFDGVLHWFETRMVPSGKDEVVAIRRDFTEERRVQAEQRRLADEQAALRRVATLVAADPPPEDVFQTVTEEVCRLLNIPEAVLERFQDETKGVIVGRFGDSARGGFDLGAVLPIEEGVVAWKVLHTGAAARVDSYEALDGELAARVRQLGFRSAVAVPINVAGAVWGTLIAPLREGESLPPETERRLQEFAELVALGVASAQAREELGASRLRIVEAGDAERRRLERNIHDGAQQRLVALSVGLRLAQGKIRDDPDEAEQLLGVVADELTEALAELRELAQGIHPAVLTEQGLGPALEVLAARTPLPVALDLRCAGRLPDAVEATAYYVVSEALANVAKHAAAESARVRVLRDDGRLAIEVEDDGVGGVDPATGSGLGGLRDRVETMGGTLWIDSSPGLGTLVRGELPLRIREPAPAGGDR